MSFGHIHRTSSSVPQPPAQQRNSSVSSIDHSKKNHQQSSSSSSLLKVLNFLGVLNMMGIFSIVFMEQTGWLLHTSTGADVESSLRYLQRQRHEQRLQEQNATDSTSSSLPKSNIDQPSNLHKGINVTLLKLRRDFGFRFLPTDTPRLPPWHVIEDQYGTGPRIGGLSTACPAFARERRKKRKKKGAILGPAGLFNSGTNLLAQLLQHNCDMSSTSSSSSFNHQQQKDHNPNTASQQWAFQVPYGKHTPAQYRDLYTIPHEIYRGMVQNYNVLPIVVIRHPYDWFRSMCTQPYSVLWPHSAQICPRLVSTEAHDANQTVPVTIQFAVANITYDSLAHVWNRWNRAYYDTFFTFPHLMVRFEDLLFYPHETIEKICTCGGGTYLASSSSPLSELKKTVNDESAENGPSLWIPKSSSKADHGSVLFGGGGDGGPNQQYYQQTTWLDAWRRYGNTRHWPRFPYMDHLVAHEILDQDMMNFFHYQHSDLVGVRREQAQQGKQQQDADDDNMNNREAHEQQ